jgi:hypothetical protein
VRPLDAVARDNAVEGCVHELYGALVALWQAYAARDPAVRTTMRSIALDEARHAALAWDVGRWADGELPAAQRRAVRRHRRDAAFALFSRVPVEPPPELVRDAGLPDGASAARLAALVSEATG